MKMACLVENTQGEKSCLYEHGLSFYIETERHRLLVDSGQSDAFIHNARILGIDLAKVDTVVVSHGHYDHAGGLLAFHQLNTRAKIYVRESAGAAYYHLTGGNEKYIGMDKAVMTLPQIVPIYGDMRIDDELFLFTGIPGRRYMAKGNFQLKKKTDSGFVQDTFDHEQCLVISENNKHVLMSGCAHSGIVNILDRYYELFHTYPDAVVSGFHMMQKAAYTDEDVANIKQIAGILQKTGAYFYSGHCTGQAAFEIMKEIMGDRLTAIHSGLRIM